MRLGKFSLFLLESFGALCAWQHVEEAASVLVTGVIEGCHSVHILQLKPSVYALRRQPFLLSSTLVSFLFWSP